MKGHKSFIMSYGSKKKQQVSKNEVVTETPLVAEIPERISEEVSESQSTSQTHFDRGMPISLDITTFVQEQSKTDETDDYETYDEIEDSVSQPATSQSIKGATYNEDRQTYDEVKEELDTVSNSQSASNTTYDDYETYDEVEEGSYEYGRSYSTPDVEDAVIIEENEDDSFSAANAYFKEEIPDRTTASSQSSQANTSQASPEEASIDRQAIAAHQEQEALENKRFEEDLKAIFQKKKVMDQEKALLDPSEKTKNKSKGVGQKPIEDELQEKMKNNHAIFDKISQSMNMANTYDFGSIAMNKKFDELEAETDIDFSKKINKILESETQKKDQIEHSTPNKPSYTSDSKKEAIRTEDFLQDIEELNKMATQKTIIETKSPDDEIPIKIEDSEKYDKNAKEFVKQSSFDSTISIKKRNLKSRIFSVNNFVALTVDSQFNPSDCRTGYTHLNVTLMKDNTVLDDEIGTHRFAIGAGPVTYQWNDLEQGEYFLRFWFTENINHTCELTGTVNIRT